MNEEITHVRRWLGRATSSAITRRGAGTSPCVQRVASLLGRSGRRSGLFPANDE